MDILIWIVAIIAAGLIAKRVISAYVGTHTPPELSGAAYLRQKLTKMGISESEVSDSCITELVQFSKHSAETHARAGSKFNVVFVQFLDSDAQLIQLWLRNPNDAKFTYNDGTSTEHRELFERHKIGLS